MEEALLAKLQERVGTLSGAPGGARSFAVYTDGRLPARCTRATVERRMASALRALLPPNGAQPALGQPPLSRGQQLLSQVTPEWIARYAARQLFAQARQQCPAQPPPTADAGAGLTQPLFSRWLEWAEAARLGAADRVAMAVHVAVLRLPTVLSLRQLREVTRFSSFTTRDVMPIFQMARTGKDTIGRRQLLTSLEAVQAAATPASDPAVQGLLPLVAHWLFEKCAVYSPPAAGVVEGDALASLSKVRRLISTLCVEFVAPSSSRRTERRQKRMRREAAAVPQLQRQLEAFYVVYAPDKLPHAREVAAAHTGYVALLNQRLRGKYGADLTTPLHLAPRFTTAPPRALNLPPLALAQTPPAQTPPPPPPPAGSVGAAAASVGGGTYGRPVAQSGVGDEGAGLDLGQLSEEDVSELSDVLGDFDVGFLHGGADDESASASASSGWESEDPAAALCKELSTELELELDALLSETDGDASDGPSDADGGATASAADSDGATGSDCAAHAGGPLPGCPAGEACALHFGAVIAAPTALSKKMVPSLASAPVAMVALQRQTTAEFLADPELWGPNEKKADVGGGGPSLMSFGFGFGLGDGFRADGASIDGLLDGLLGDAAMAAADLPQGLALCKGRKRSWQHNDLTGQRDAKVPRLVA